MLSYFLFDSILLDLSESRGAGSSDRVGCNQRKTIMYSVFFSFILVFILSACSTTTFPVERIENLENRFSVLEDRLEELEIVRNHEYMALDAFLRHKEGKGKGVYVQETSGFGLQKLEGFKVGAGVIVTVSSRLKHDGTYCVWNIYLWNVSRQGVIRLRDNLKIEEGSTSSRCNAQERFRQWDFLQGSIDPPVNVLPLKYGPNRSPIVR